MSAWQVDVVFAMSVAMLVMIVAGLVSDRVEERRKK